MKTLTSNVLTPLDSGDFSCSPCLCLHRGIIKLCFQIAVSFRLLRVLPIRPNKHETCVLANAQPAAIESSFWRSALAGYGSE